MVKNKILKGRVTLPSEEGMEKETRELIHRWGVDGIRNSDGTNLTPELSGMTEKVYYKHFPTRIDQKWAKSNKDQLQQMYIMSEPVIVDNEHCEINILKGYYNEQLEIDTIHDPMKWWEVIDRTTGEVVSSDFWRFDTKSGKVVLDNANKWHKYTVSFLVFVIWDSVQMYNHITNNWTKDHEMPYDPRHYKTRIHILEYLEQWLIDNKDVTVVRFTTFFYNFTLVFNEQAKERYVDWFGYSGCVSIITLEEFEKVKGYKLRPEDLIDQGYYNTPFKTPSKEYLDYIDFTQQFVCELAKECVDIVHKYNREAIMFLGDQWIGTEPYGKYFKNIGLDGVVGSVGSGVTLRMIADIKGVNYTEGRFLPYFFPDVFCEEGDPVKEAKENWLCARRAILQKPLDRIGYGGYLSLAVKFPKFLDCVEEICNEFRGFHNHIKNTEPYKYPFKIGILNAWGDLRTWQTHQVAHSLWYKKLYSYVGMLESLSGMSVDVSFISFDDIKTNGIDKDIGVIINAGDGGTSWSGDEYWIDEKVVTTMREWVHNGGGFIGIGEPTAYLYQGAYFQLSDVLGVDKEIGYTLSYTRYDNADSEHFITKNLKEDIDFGESMKSIHSVGDNTQILSMEENDITLAVNTYGQGRSVYIAGLPYSNQNTELLLKSLFWVAGKEKEMRKWYCTNINTQCIAYPQVNEYIVINNSYEEQETDVFLNNGKVIKMILKPMESKWFEI